MRKYGIFLLVHTRPSTYYSFFLIFTGIVTFQQNENYPFWAWFNHIQPKKYFFQILQKYFSSKSCDWKFLLYLQPTPV